ncbi:MAG TPA: molybdopterin molybdotransferase MoeA, partial [Opitutaceae bacterium]|nr:molybdopterin molybdotransferase MoeA [Opitutaceae bacterium]
MLLSPSDAAQRILASIVPLPSEDCALGSAHGRVVRKDLHSDRALPPFDRVTMDGYATRSRVFAAAAIDAPITLKVQGAPQMAGMIARSLPEADDTCIEVMTGAVLPQGADCVVPYEDTQREPNASVITLPPGSAQKFREGTFVHRRGSDLPANSVIVKAGTRLSGREIAVAAACGHAGVRVSALPRLAVVSTGDELVDISSAVAPHQIRRSNDIALRATLIQAGYSYVDSSHLRDVPAEISNGLGRLLASCDALIITGGVSKGRHDHIPSTLTALGVTAVFHGVAQRPGKPFWFGMSPRRKPVFALPGNPVSCFTCLHQYVLPALRSMSGLPPQPPHWVVLSQEFSALPKMTSFVPVHLRSQADGRVLAQPDPFNTSGDFAGLVGT